MKSVAIGFKSIFPQILRTLEFTDLSLIAQNCMKSQSRGASILRFLCLDILLTSNSYFCNRMQRKYDENHWPSTQIEIKLANQNLNQKVKKINLIG